MSQIVVKMKKAHYAINGNNGRCLINFLNSNVIMKRLKSILLLVACGLLAAMSVHAQDSLYYRGLVERLASEECRGRGYSGRGDSIAAQLIVDEWKQLGLQKWTPDYLQPFTFAMNLYEGDASVHFDTQDSVLVLFENVQFEPYSCGVKGTFKVKEVPIDKMADLYKAGKTFENQFVCFDISALNSKDSSDKLYLDAIQELCFHNYFKAKGYILVSEQLRGWHIGYGKFEKSHTVINVCKSALKKMPRKVTVSLDQRFDPDYKSQNIAAFIPGKTHPDSFIVFTGHYEHLGKFGRDYTFYGANDNASGAAFVIDLARHFSQPENRPDYSIAFLHFTGEEEGLWGSFYYCDHPLFPLDNIKALINLDMVGTGEEGVTVVCATAFPHIYNILTTINDEKQYLAKVASRGPAANSDHYPFYKKGCPALFIYGMGKSGRYHSCHDTAEAMSYGGYTGLFKLMVDFVQWFQLTGGLHATE